MPWGSITALPASTRRSNTSARTPACGLRPARRSCVTGCSRAPFSDRGTRLHTELALPARCAVVNALFKGSVVSSAVSSVRCEPNQRPTPRCQERRPCWLSGKSAITASYKWTEFAADSLLEGGVCWPPPAACEPIFDQGAENLPSATARRAPGEPSQTFQKCPPSSGSFQCRVPTKYRCFAFRKWVERSSLSHLHVE